MAEKGRGNAGKAGISKGNKYNYHYKGANRWIYSAILIAAVVTVIAVAVVVLRQNQTGQISSVGKITENDTGFSENYCKSLLVAQDSVVADMIYQQTGGSLYMFKIAFIEDSEGSIFFRGSNIVINLRDGLVESCTLDRYSNISLLAGDWISCGNGDAKLVAQENESFLFIGMETSEDFEDGMRRIDPNYQNITMPDNLKKLYSSTIAYYNPNSTTAYNRTLGNMKTFLRNEFACEV